MTAPFAYGVPQERDWNALTDDAFRAIVREEFQTHYPVEQRFPPRRLRWHENKAWYLRMAAKGWIAPAWPVEYGGMGLSPGKLLIFIEEQERCGVMRFQDHGIQMVGPVLMKFGTEEQKRRYLPSILSCEHIWCQGYSEPNSGSDLASLSTRAVLDGDDFVVTGQKIWTTLAHDATHMFALVRTDPAAKKQEGISFLLLDVNSPGVRIRPIRNIAGHEDFCEVFLDGVRTHRSNLVSELNRGWTVAKSLLGFERIFLGSPKLPEYGLSMLEKLARARGVFDDPLFRDRYQTLKLDVTHLADLYGQYADTIARGGRLGDDVSMLKIWASETFQRVADLIVETAGPFASLAGEVPVDGVDMHVLAPFYNARVPTIYGGSSEIQRNILARQVLGLPG